MVRLVHRDHVRDLHHARLEGLDRVPAAGHQHQDDRVGVVDDVHLGLPHPDGLEEDVVLAARVHQQRGLERRLGEPAKRAATRHGADVHARVEEVVREADAVAEQRPLGEGRAGVDRQHGHLAVASARVLDQAADERRLADPGRPREAHNRGVPRVRIDLANERPALGIVVLDQRDRARQGTLVAGKHALGEVGGCGSGARHGWGLYAAGSMRAVSGANGSGEGVAGWAWGRNLSRSRLF